MEGMAEVSEYERPLGKASVHLIPQILDRTNILSTHLALLSMESPAVTSKK